MGMLCVFSSITERNAGNAYVSLCCGARLVVWLVLEIPDSVGASLEMLKRGLEQRSLASQPPPPAVAPPSSPPPAIKADFLQTLSPVTEVKWANKPELCHDEYQILALYLWHLNTHTHTHTHTHPADIIWSSAKHQITLMHLAKRVVGSRAEWVCVCVCVCVDSINRPPCWLHGAVSLLLWQEKSAFFFLALERMQPIGQLWLADSVLIGGV